MNNPDRVAYFIEDSKTKLRWMWWNEQKCFHRTSAHAVGQLITYDSIAQAKAAIRNIKDIKIPYWSNRDDLIVRKLYYKIEDIGGKNES